MPTPKEILKKYWGHESFRNNQESIIDAVLLKKDALALLPTGGGKSVCFQIPALMNEGLCLVISPLIALMKDQVEHLTSKGISAIALESSFTYQEIKSILIQVKLGDYKFLYISPERLQSSLFQQFIGALNIQLIVIDEAHCISQWGYDFRPAYLKIHELRKQLIHIPIIALTASATKIVVEDIVKKLELKNVSIFKESTSKTNLSYSQFNVDAKTVKLIEILTNVSGSSVVYCKNRKECKRVCDLLLLHQFNADFYHAGLTHVERNKKQENWIKNKTRIIVCTNAFGMGIDKPDVRTVVHYSIPDCLENYYQEAGRAGRDGKKAYAVLLYNSIDISALKSSSNLKFPVIFDIKKVYQSIANYLQIPVGIGEGNYYDFDLIDFCKKFEYDIFLAIGVIKALEQDGHITFNESVFLPSKIIFLADKESLHQFEQTNQELDVVVKCLLRTYEGIFDNYVSINEKLLAKLCKTSLENLQSKIDQLYHYKIIDYQKQKTTPQLYFVYNRAPAQSIHFNYESYLKRKATYDDRVDAMLNYINQKEKCRSIYIGEYFNDETQLECGICDICIAKKTTTLQPPEFNKIKAKIEELLNTDNFQMKNFLPFFKAYKKENVWKVLQFLEEENQIIIDKYGMISKVN